MVHWCSLSMLAGSSYWLIDDWTGLDGTLVFLEHVGWVIILIDWWLNRSGWYTGVLGTCWLGNHIDWLMIEQVWMVHWCSWNMLPGSSYWLIDDWTGLDGTLVFLEHVGWVISLNSLFILIFAFCPYHIGHFTLSGKLLFLFVHKSSHYYGYLYTNLHIIMVIRTQIFTLLWLFVNKFSHYYGYSYWTLHNLKKNNSLQNEV